MVYGEWWQVQFGFYNCFILLFTETLCVFTWLKEKVFQEKPFKKKIFDILLLEYYG